LNANKGILSVITKQQAYFIIIWHIISQRQNTIFRGYPKTEMPNESVRPCTNVSNFSLSPSFLIVSQVTRVGSIIVK